MKVGIIGAGLIGDKRANVILNLSKEEIISVFDIDKKKSKKLAQKIGCKVATNYQELINDKDIDIVIIAVPTNVSLKICKESIGAKKNILCEKPLGRNYKEAKFLFDLAKKEKVILKVGFNHRFHQAIKKAHQLVKNRVIGKLMYIRAVYGHGGRKGYDTEWRMQRKISGGGELLDQGIHIIDLARWFLGEFKEGIALNENLFWRKSSLEDNSFSILKTNDRKLIFFQVSTTQWKNKFLFEIFGEKGYIIVDGLGGSYGKEKLIVGIRKKLGERPDEEIFEFEERDISWEEEWKEFTSAVKEKREPLGNSYDGMMANKIIDALYKSSRDKKVIRI